MDAASDAPGVAGQAGDAVAPGPSPDAGAPRSRTVTGPPPGTRVETLPSVPGLGGLYVRGAAGSAAARIPGRTTATTLPAVAHRVEGVRVDPGHLTSYQHLLGETGSDALPSGFCHVLAFPVATAVMVRPDFPLPLLGMVHVANAASVLRPVHLGDALDVTAWTQDLRAHRRGTQLDVCAEIAVDGEVAWRGVSTYLAKGVHLVGGTGSAEAPGAEPSGTAEVSGVAATVGAEKSSGTEASSGVGTSSGRVGASVAWRLGADVGRAYGAVSGDRNPIHMSALSAKAFGFPRAIAHGMYTAARALADVGPRRGTTYDWTVEFAKPVLLPGRVDVTYTTMPDGSWTYAGRSQSGKLHLAGSVTPTT
ncbi:MaoC/PaaZ C-terminal domain-containing protein [Sanguibacter sp. HDW7]|uniref:MaoC family dehydratase n=1 Tax=Sanguibacter sp. HDW7 TaxID=2714931 RepID=UPI0014086B84|nr:MaoC/PaaZ C-terminal domain-containing protein [Sanguibacter sp. HDW7]QIK84515.1 hypothetical protein G7063_13515 [Sanguibacter sp. HDW7]